MESSSTNYISEKSTYFRNAAYLILFSICSAVVARRPNPRSRVSHAKFLDAQIRL